jgi:hypothetical protein
MQNQRTAARTDLILMFQEIDMYILDQWVRHNVAIAQVYSPYVSFFVFILQAFKRFWVAVGRYIRTYTELNYIQFQRWFDSSSGRMRRLSRETAVHETHPEDEAAEFLLKVYCNKFARLMNKWVLQCKFWPG